ncbi:MAG: hypothetical protein KDC44_20185, partial [Phaeodactylibacter sp.]|nr:hypothetical protein [Phaeodactylibacter sp.]
MKQSFTSTLAGLFVLAWSWMPVVVSAANPDDCTDPVINTVTSDLNDVCPNTTVELTVDGVLNDATDWFWYTVDCGDTPVGSGAAVSVMPTGTTTYYVRGEPGCVGDLPCASITIAVLDPDAPVLTIPADATIECGEPLLPVVDACTPIAILHGEVVLNLPATGTYQLDAALFDLASVDACGGGALTFSFSPITTDTERTIDCSDIGTQTLTLWVTDALNNQITAEVMLTVEDVIDDCNIGGGCHPMPLLLKHLVVSLDETGSATVSASTFDLSSVDICGEGPLTFSFSSDIADTDSTFTCANLGLDTLEVWVNDPAGNQVYATVEVTVQDPYDICNGTIVACAPVAVYEAGIVATIPADRDLPLQALLFDQASQDHCVAGSLSFAFSGTPSGAAYTFGCADVGLQSLTIEVTDGLGNTNSADVQINIQDLDGNCQGVGSAYATDNCDPNPMITYVDASNPGSCGGQDTITRTWTATDLAGNSVSADQIIIIEDTTAPLIECPADQTGSFNADCAFEVPDYTGLVTAGDDCELLPEIVQSPAPGTLITASTTVTITATDGCGNSSDCDFQLTLSDDQAPTLTCLSDQVGVIDADCAFEIPDYSTQLVFEDNCDPNPLFVQSPIAGTFITETTTVTITLTDASGNSNVDCSFEITLPNAAPVLSELPADKTVECASQIPDSGGISAFDDCDGEVQVIFTQTGLPLDCVGNGTVINTWTATDSDGNSTSHSQTITILDETAPVLSALPTDMTISCLGDLPADPEITATDNCEGAIPVIYLQSPLPDCIGSGTVTRTWVAQDCNGNSIIHAQTITIEDTAEPGFSQYPGSLTVECLADVPGDPGITATDLCEGNIDVVFEQSMLPGCNGQGEVLNTWTATDCAGNVSTHTQTITINDVTPPVFSQQPGDITVQCGDDVPGDPGITATDNCDIDVEVVFSQTTLPACDEGGMVMNTWTASDCKGNTSTHTQIVTIEDTTAPVFSEEPENLTVECVDEVPNPSALTATDNCDGEVSVTFEQTGYP